MHFLFSYRKYFHYMWKLRKFYVAHLTNFFWWVEIACNAFCFHSSWKRIKQTFTYFYKLFPLSKSINGHALGRVCSPNNPWFFAVSPMNFMNRSTLNSSSQHYATVLCIITVVLAWSMRVCCLMMTHACVCLTSHVNAICMYDFLLPIHISSFVHLSIPNCYCHVCVSLLRCVWEQTRSYGGAFVGSPPKFCCAKKNFI